MPIDKTSSSSALRLRGSAAAVAALVMVGLSGFSDMQVMHTLARIEPVMAAMALEPDLASPERDMFRAADPASATNAIADEGREGSEGSTRAADVKIESAEEQKLIKHVADLEQRYGDRLRQFAGRLQAGDRAGALKAIGELGVIGEEIDSAVARMNGNSSAKAVASVSPASAVDLSPAFAVIVAAATLGIGGMLGLVAGHAFRGAAAPVAPRHQIAGCLDTARIGSTSRMEAVGGFSRAAVTPFDQRRPGTGESATSGRTCLPESAR